MRRKRGQAVVLLLAILVVMTVLAFWMLNIHSYILRRLEAQDAGDAAALAMARWQAAGLNLIGELNLIHAYMLCDTTSRVEDAEALFELQQRVSLVTPMLGLAAAQEVAKLNGAEPLEGAQEYLRDYGKVALFDSYYEGAKEDVEAMLEYLTQSEIYAFPVVPLESQSNGNLLVNQDFYEAILDRDWCWFWFHAYDFLQQYHSRSNFGRPPTLDTGVLGDLGLDTRTASLAEIQVTDSFDAQLTALGHPTLPPPISEPDPYAWKRQVTQSWMIYAPERWTAWTSLEDLPMRADVKDAYDYEGVAAVVSVQKNGTSWLAAAKAFGSINDQPPMTYEFVLGGFKAVRLIPVDAAGAGLVSFDIAWLRHVHTHLQSYIATGACMDDCRYCRALRLWESAAFRATGIAWLAQFGDTCRRPSPGHATDGGGAHYAH